MNKIAVLLLALLLVSCTTATPPEPTTPAPVDTGKVFTEYCNKSDWIPIGEDSCFLPIGDDDLKLRVSCIQDDQGNCHFSASFTVFDFSVASDSMYDDGITNLTEVISKIAPSEADTIIEAVLAQRIRCSDSGEWDSDGEGSDCSSHIKYINGFSYIIIHSLTSDRMYVWVYFLED